MKIKITMRRTGPPAPEVLEMVKERETVRILENVREAIDRSGEYHRSGRLRAGLYMVRTGRGADLMAPPDRLRQRGPRQGFIELLKRLLPVVRR